MTNTQRWILVIASLLFGLGFFMIGLQRYESKTNMLPLDRWTGKFVSDSFVASRPTFPRDLAALEFEDDFVEVPEPNTA